MRAFATTLAVLALGCSPPEDGPLMSPGENCLACHGAPGTGSDHGAPQWTVAGTLFRDPHAAATAGLYGATVTVTDAKGKQVAMSTGGTGNFYTAEPLDFPVQVEVRKGELVARMANADSGACNACHALEPLNGAPGRVFLRP